jgi:hypothetical protein
MGTCCTAAAATCMTACWHQNEKKKGKKKRGCTRTDIAAWAKKENEHETCFEEQ